MIIYRNAYSFLNVNKVHNYMMCKLLVDLRCVTVCFIVFRSTLASLFPELAQYIMFTQDTLTGSHEKRMMVAIPKLV
jgi:hypothetical protein